MLNDLVDSCLKCAENEPSVLETKIKKAQEIQEKEEVELNKLKESIETGKKDLDDFFNEHFKRLDDHLEATQLNDIKEFLESEIGEEGAKLEKVIEDRLKLEMDLVRLEFEELQQQFKANWGDGSCNFNWGDSEFEEILRILKNIFVSSAFAGIFTTLAESLMGIFGGVGKFVNVAGKGLAMLGAVLTAILEVVQIFMEEQAKENLEKFKKDLRNKLEEIHQAVLEIVAKWYAKSIEIYQEHMQSLQEHQAQIDADTTHKNALEAWMQQGEGIKAQMEALY